MELGKGKWITESDLIALRDQFLDHLSKYDKIFTLRCLASGGESQWSYELVEIPIPLLLLAASAKPQMKHDSGQNPKPGYCEIIDSRGDAQFELYFDGGTERKLQIKNLLKSSCHVIATWKFARF